MYARLDYAFQNTLGTLRAVFRTNDDYVIITAFTITLVGFCGIQVAIEHNIIQSLISGCATATLFFLTILGFVTIISVVYTFSYGFSIGCAAGLGAPSLSSWSRAWRGLLSLVVTGVVTAAVFGLFCDGLGQTSFAKEQYVFFVSDGN